MGTNIVARIPVDPSMEMISYEDNGGDYFQFYPPSTHLDNLAFYITDLLGRPLRSLLTTRAARAPLPFNLSLRWDAVVPDPRPPKPAHGPFTGNYRDAITPLD